MSDDEYQTVPPNSGWSFCVGLTAFFIQFMCEGVFYCFVTYYDEMAADLDTTIGVIDGTYCFSSFFYFTACIPGIPLLNIFQCRFIGVCAGIIALSGYLLASFFCHSYILLYFLQGVLSGFGLGLSYFTSRIVLSYYFYWPHGFEIGIDASDTGLAQIAMPPLIYYFRVKYGWRISYYLLAALLSTNCIFALTYLPLTPVPLQDRVTKSKIIHNCACLTDKRLRKKRNSYSRVIDCSLLKSPAFFIFLISAFILNGVYTCFSFNLVQRGKWLGIPEGTSIYFLLVFSVMNGIGKMSAYHNIIFFQRYTFLSLSLASAISFILAGLVGFLGAFEFSKNLVAQFVLSGFAGHFFGSFYYRQKLAVELFGKENVKKAFAINYLVVALGVSIINAIYCLIVDKFGYMLVFEINFGLAIAGAVLCLILKPIREWEKRKGILPQENEDLNL